MNRKAQMPVPLLARNRQTTLPNQTPFETSNMYKPNL